MSYVKWPSGNKKLQFQYNIIEKWKWKSKELNAKVLRKVVDEDGKGKIYSEAELIKKDNLEKILLFFKLVLNVQNTKWE